MRIGIFLFLLVQLFSYAAESKPKIYWHITDWPPYFFIDGEMKGEGEADSIIYKAIELMPEYEHEVMVTPSKRTYTLMDKQPNHCRSGMFKNPEREEKYLFAKHNQYYFPYGLTTLKKHLPLFRPYLDENNYLDLDKALSDKKITIAIAESQSYGASVDQILKKHEGSPHIQKVNTGVKVREALLRRLFAADWYQATLAIPEEFNYLANEQKLNKDALLYFPIKGTKLFGSSWWGYIACSKSDLGKEVVSKINKNINILRNVSVTKYRNFLDDSARKIHEKAEKRVFE